jgi:hypothetical protein
MTPTVSRPAIIIAGAVAIATMVGVAVLVWLMFQTYAQHDRAEAYLTTYCLSSGFSATACESYADDMFGNSTQVIACGEQHPPAAQTRAFGECIAVLELIPLQP